MRHIPLLVLFSCRPWAESAAAAAAAELLDGLVRLLLPDGDRPSPPPFAASLPPTVAERRASAGSRWRVRRRNRFWHDADIRLPYSSQLRPRIDAKNAGAIAIPSLDYPTKRVAGKWPREERPSGARRVVIQCSRVRSPARPFQLASVKLVPAAVPNCGTCGTAISALLGEAVMARILYETLLLSCVAAFAIGVVIAAASVFG